MAYICKLMSSVRQEKFASLIKKDLAEIIQSMTHSNFEGQMILINDVNVSPDLGYVKAYLGFLNTTDKTYSLGLVNYYKKEIRHLLAQRIKNQVRKIPELEFFIDDTLDYALHIEQILDKIKKEEPNI
jgi:ribosome-binding factor A